MISSCALCIHEILIYNALISTGQDSLAQTDPSRGSTFLPSGPDSHLCTVDTPTSRETKQSWWFLSTWILLNVRRGSNKERNVALMSEGIIPIHFPSFHLEGFLYIFQRCFHCGCNPLCWFWREFRAAYYVQPRLCMHRLQPYLISKCSHVEEMWVNCLYYPRHAWRDLGLHSPSLNTKHHDALHEAQSRLNFSFKFKPKYN